MPVVAPIVAGSGVIADGAAYLLHQNLLDENSPTLTPTTAATGFEAANAATWRPYERWKSGSSADQTFHADFGSAVNVQAFGLHAHNLADVGGSVIVEYSTDNAAWSTFGSGTVTPSDNSTIVRVVAAAVSARYWRARFTGLSDVVRVGNLFLGPVLQLPGLDWSGFTPPGLARDADIMNSEAEDGEFLGRSLWRRAGVLDVSIPVLALSWAYTSWDAFAEAAELHPYYFTWDAETYPDDAGFCYSSSREIGRPAMIASNLMAVRLKGRTR